MLLPTKCLRVLLGCLVLSSASVSSARLAWFPEGRPRHLSADAPSPTQTAACTKKSGLAVVLTAQPKPNDLRAHLYLWMGVANKRAYASRHGYSLFVATKRFQSARQASWERIILLKAVMQHESCPEWIWMVDCDAFIMDMSVKVTDIIAETEKGGNGSVPLQGIVTNDCNGLNIGSMLLRNSPWMLDHMSDVWATVAPEVAVEIGHVSRPVWEQDSIAYLIKHDPSVSKRYAVIPQRKMNAFSPSLACHDGSGLYQDGDFIVHFVDTAKRTDLDLESDWLDKLPLLPYSSGNTHRQHVSHEALAVPPRAYAVWPAGNLPSRLSHNKRLRTLDVELRSPKDPEIEFHGSYVFQPEPLTTLNPGWPLHPSRFVWASVQAHLRRFSKVLTPDYAQVEQQSEEGRG